MDAHDPLAMPAPGPTTPPREHHRRIEQLAHAIGATTTCRSTRTGAPTTAPPILGGLAVAVAAGVVGVALGPLV